MASQGEGRRGRGREGEGMALGNGGRELMWETR